MAKEDHLFQLIKSLDQGEKRFISLNISSQKGDENKDYLRLFDFLQKLHEYEEDIVKQQLSHLIPIHRFAAVKNYLYTKLLNLLRDYHADDSVDTQIRNYLQLVEMLFKKGLIRQAEKQLSSAKKLAEKHFKNRQLIQIYDWEYSISTVSETAVEREFTFRRIDLEEQQALKNLSAQFDYHRLHFKLFNHLYQYGVPQKEEDRIFFREILNDPLMLQEPDVPPYTLDLYYSILNACNYMCADYEQAAVAGKARLKVFAKHEDFAIGESYQYAAAINNYLQNINNLAKWQEMELIIESANNFADKQQKKILAVSYMLFKFVVHQFKIKTLMAQRLFVETGFWVKQHQKDIHALLDQKAKEKNVYILPLSISVNCFILGKNEDALNWIRTILNDDRNSIRNDIYNFSAIFNLMIHYELGNFSLLEYQQQSLQRYLNEQGKNSDFETLVPNLLLKMADRKPGRDELKKILVMSLEKLREIVGSQGFESTFIKQFYIIEYFESKLAGKSILDYLLNEKK